MNRSSEKNMLVMDKPTTETTSQSVAISSRDKMKNIANDSIETKSKPELKSEVLNSAELTDGKIKEISDFFRFIFNNDWPEFVVCPPCDSKLPEGMRLSAFDVYGTDQKHVPLEILDNYPKIPCCPNCNEDMKIFHDPEKTFQNIKGKLSNDAYVSLLRSEENNNIAGFAFGTYFYLVPPVQ